MSLTARIPVDESTPAAAIGTRRRDGAPRCGDVPVLEAQHDGLAARFAGMLEGRHPVVVFLVAALTGYVLLAALSVASGLLLMKGLAVFHGVGSADERPVAWLAEQRTPTVIEASLIGSIGAGGVVIPGLVGATAFALGCARRWRVAAFIVAAIAVEVATYRLTTIVVHRDRPGIPRLEQLPADASYPSGHTAAAVAVYCGLALVLTSRFTSTWLRVACWSIALAIPVFVAFARMARGMHHPLDTAAGAAIGVGALLVALLAARAAGAATEARRREARP